MHLWKNVKSYKLIIRAVNQNSLNLVKNHKMKNLVNLIFSLTICFSFSQNKATTVSYKKTYAIDFDKEENSKQNTNKNQALQLLKEVNSELSRKTYKLWFNDSLSCFKELKQMDLENTSSMVSILSEGLGITNGIFYIKKNSKQLIHQKTFDSDKYLIHSNIDSLIWKIKKDTKQIGNYTVYKATTTIQRVTRSGLTNGTITAWYTPEIPSSFGPAGFNNLPGLILEIQFGKLSLYVDEIEFNKDVDVSSLEPTKGKKISKEDFITLELKQVYNPSD